MEEGFFRKATQVEHEAVLKNEKKPSEIKVILVFSEVVFIILLIGYVFNHVVNTSIPIDSRSLLPDEYNYWSRVILLSVTLLITTIVLIWMFALSRKHMIKIKNGDYAVQTVMVMGKGKAGKGEGIDTFRFSFMSEGGMIYLANIISLFARNIHEKEIGLLVMINEDTKDNPKDAYRFIPISEYDPDFRQRAGAFSLKGTKPVFDPRKNKLDPRFNKLNFPSKQGSDRSTDREGVYGKARIDTRLNKLGARNNDLVFDDLSAPDSVSYEARYSSGFKRPTDKQHKDVMRYYKPRLTFDLTMFAVFVLCIIAGYSMLFAAFTFSADVPVILGPVSIILILIPLICLFIRGIKLMLYSDYALVVMVIFTFIINGLTLPIPLAGDVPVYVIQCVAAGGLLINLVFAVYFYLDSLVLWSRLIKREYVVTGGVVTGVSKESSGTYRYHWTTYKIAVRSENGAVFELDRVLRHQYKECSIASDVLLIIPDVIKWQDSANIRLAVKPFGHK